MCIYIKIPIEISFERLKERDLNEDFDLRYLKDINQKYNSWLSKFYDVPVYEINEENIDINKIIHLITSLE